ncbi:ligase-associated DNA damage response endonuclease PdeM [Erythrobacter insulae]|uniref:Ligase-associated DNA damage response endonuclease PdeM n=1 Tax=Erythrobacter insulae TaxID=2584124 RepID=A0A547PCP3_9SPHN|nr:ligase-associated DNA damage response endonuclease PdeM [Erythrobacter insulae]TRD11911.1 ligase-associated DNA damage response endonuclease PdeM [Erythrobacter insulae]
MVPVSFAPLDFAGEELVLMKSNALFWPSERALLVADLHLEKGSWYAKHGQMLPPYDSRETLERIADSVKATGARRVITLGDNFHDDAGTHRLDPYAAGMLEALTRALDWVWITGNHDENMHRSFGATLVEELEINGIILRHEAKRGETRAELSGHYHPKMRLKVRNRHIARPCGVISRQAGQKTGQHTGQHARQGDRMILPAFGAYTGGMDAGSPEILDALGPASRIDAVLPAKGKLVTFPLYRAAA